MANEDDHLQVRSPYLDARGAIAYLQLPSHSSLYRLIRQHALPFNRRGRLYLFDPAGSRRLGERLWIGDRDGAR